MALQLSQLSLTRIERYAHLDVGHIRCKTWPTADGQSGDRAVDDAANVPQLAHANNPPKVIDQMLRGMC